MSKLSNCYIPLPLSVLTEAKSDEKKRPKERDSGDGGWRSDSKASRPNHSLRRLVLESGILSSTPGSALVELGHTKVLCQVFGPVTAAPDLLPSSVPLSMDEGTLYYEVKYLPHVGYPTSTMVASSVSYIDQSSLFSYGRIHSQIMTRETDLSSRLLSALTAAVPLQQYPKCALVVRVTILQDDGSVLPVCVTAASLALANARVEMYDLVTCCSVAVVRNNDDGGDNDKQSAQQHQLLADPDLEEERRADALVTLAILPNWKEVTLWEQSGKLSPAVANQAMDLCRDGCRTMQRFTRDHLLEQNKKSENL